MILGSTTITTNAGVQEYLVKRYVNFNGTGTLAIRKASGVGGVGDIGTGTYSIIFSNAFPDANFAILTSQASFSATQVSRHACAKASESTGALNRVAGSCQVLSGVSSTSGLTDHADIHVAFLE